MERIRGGGEKVVDEEKKESRRQDRFLRNTTVDRKLQEVAPSTRAEIECSERKLEMS